MRFRAKPMSVLAFLFAFLPSPATAAVLDYSGMFSGSNSVAPISSTATGSFAATLTDVTNSHFLNLSFFGLTGPATAAHIHCCAAIDANTPVVIRFTGFPTAISGTNAHTFVGVAQAKVDGIKAGLAYINIHDATFPAGEIRAQSSPKHPRRRAGP